MNWIESEQACGRFDIVIAFIYQSSSVTAAYLADLDWPENVHVICNAFWDFRIDAPSAKDTTFARVKQSGSVSLTAMSGPHRDQIQDATGCRFAAIPNPPPLVSDARFYELLRAAALDKAERYQRLAPTVFLPGLQSAGKGKEITEDFVASSACKEMAARILVRDRQHLLSEEQPATQLGNLRYLIDSFSDSEIIGFYRQADVAALPYTSDVFGVRTSGALVDCMMSGVVPVVFPGTWLAHICTQFDFGIVCAGQTAAAMSDGINAALADLPAQRHRIFFAAIRYMSENSWGRFLELLLEQGGQGPALEAVRETSWSFLETARKAEVILLEGGADLPTLSADSERWRLVSELFENPFEYMMAEQPETR
ncbi:glycosyltransferase family 4 protein [Thalassovita gelatinovora]|uniref:glycosyltransferase family 4 protein n=1 Tax=Thalassovita gelatinovora TaxID=53501 RepID=UPI0011145D76|nr:glycosyltransferase family 4 protein [Thalassovita gelatinovora]QIZ82665.1 glycosyltransferase family 4 protein [Thalassovita gelatinovora]